MWIGGAAMIGDLSKFAEVKVTPTVMNYIIVPHSLGAVPVFVEITCADGSVAATTDGNIRYALLGTQCGVVYGLYTNQSKLMYRTFYRNDATNLSVEQYALNSEQIIIRNRNDAFAWNTSTEYTVKIYA